MLCVHGLRQIHEETARLLCDQETYMVRLRDQESLLVCEIMRLRKERRDLKDCHRDLCHRDGQRTRPVSDADEDDE